MEDLRSYIKVLEDEGELARITTEVDWNLEMGAIIRKVMDNGGPAIMFENIKDYKDTIATKMFANGITRKTLPLAFGRSKDTNRDELSRMCAEAIRNPVMYKTVETGPVKENKITGSDIDLYQFPTPLWHSPDGGRYMMTYCASITRDPDTGEHNVGAYRGMLTARDEFSVLIILSQGWGVHFSKYCQRQEKMPIAVVWGAEPLLGIVAGSQFPMGMDEYKIMGALKGEPVPLVKCENSDIMVPATAEMVVEGYVDPDPANYAMEGTFGEYTGYYGGARRPRHTLKVDCITHRNDPIFRGSMEGSGPGHPNENTWIYSVTSKVNFLEALERAGVPGIIDVRPGPVCYVKIRQAYNGHAKQVANALWGSWSAEWMYKILVVVDHDIDIYDHRQIDWALCYRMEPGTHDIITMPHTRGGGLDLADYDDTLFGTGSRGRILLDATRDIKKAKRDAYGNLDWGPFSYDLDTPERELIERRWEEYGIKLPERKKRR